MHHSFGIKKNFTALLEKEFKIYFKFFSNIAVKVFSISK